jgi:hypothetical protein
VLGIAAMLGMEDDDLQARLLLIPNRFADGLVGQPVNEAREHGRYTR